MNELVEIRNRIAPDHDFGKDRDEKIRIQSRWEKQSQYDTLEDIFQEHQYSRLVATTYSRTSAKVSKKTTQRQYITERASSDNMKLEPIFSSRL